jgi:hypothetical protein
MPARILKFVSRTDQLRMRGIGKWGRFLTKSGPYSSPHPCHRARLQHERVECSAQDAEWGRRHGSIPGGGLVLEFPAFESELLLLERVTKPGQAASSDADSTDDEDGA